MKIVYMCLSIIWANNNAVSCLTIHSALPPSANGVVMTENMAPSLK